MHIIKSKTLIFLKFFTFFFSSPFKTNISISYKQQLTKIYAFNSMYSLMTSCNEPYKSCRKTNENENELALSSLIWEWYLFEVLYPRF